MLQTDRGPALGEIRGKAESMRRTTRRSDLTGMASGIFFAVSILWWIFHHNALLGATSLALVVLAAAVDFVAGIYLGHGGRCIRLDLSTREFLTEKRESIERSIGAIRNLTRLYSMPVMGGLAFWVATKEPTRAEFVSFAVSLCALILFLDWRNSRKIGRTLRPVLDDIDRELADKGYSP